jgi:hypothetical protein
MSFIVAGSIIAGTGVAGKLISGLSGGKKRRAEQRNANAAFDQQMKAYSSFDITNPYSNLTNPGANLSSPASSLSNSAANLTNFAAGMQNTAVGATNFASQMENTAEDLTVNTQQAEFQAQQQQQGLANTLGSMRGAAGSSGIAALAQSLAGQQSQNLQAASASIGQQEASNRQLAAQQGANIQQAIAGESSINQAREIDQASQNQILSAQMGSANQMAGVDIAQQNQILAAQQAQSNQQFGATMGFEGQSLSAQGAAQQQQMQLDQIGTQLSFAANRKGSADQARAQAKQNAVSAFGDLTGFGSSMVSDRKLKKNIKLIKKSPQGYNVYSFEYKNKKYGEGVFQGVMADEVPKEFTVKNSKGDSEVYYSKLDVEFKRIGIWQ